MVGAKVRKGEGEVREITTITEEQQEEQGSIKVVTVKTSSCCGYDENYFVVQMCPRTVFELSILKV